MNKQVPIIADIEWFKRMSVRAPSSRAAGRTGKGGRAPERSMDHQGWRVANGSNAAVFKRIRNAGTHHPKQLAGQMAYINGKADLVFGNGIDYEMGDAALTQEAVEAMIEQWSDGWRGQPKNGHTTHLVLSFPGHVTAEQTAAIVEEWCEDMFQAVDAGMDEWSYYAAVHLDQEHHPHVHVIVNNRGLREGEWFYMAEGHDFSYQNMKQRMVEISEDYGVYLDASTRLERGVVEYAPSHAEYRRSIRLGIEPKGRARTGADLDKAYGTMFAYAQQFRAMATVADSIEQSEMADRLRSAADELEEARPIYVEGSNRMEIDVNQHPADIRDALNQWAERNEERIASLPDADRKEVTEQLHTTLDHIETVLDRDYQVQWTPPEAQMQTYKAPIMETAVGDVDSLYQSTPFKMGFFGSTYVQEGERVAAYRSVGSDMSVDDRMAIFRDEEVLENYLTTGVKPEGWDREFEAVEASFNERSTISLNDVADAISSAGEEAEAIGLDATTFKRRIVRGAINAREEESWVVQDIERVADARGLDATDDAALAEATAAVREVHNSIEPRLLEVERGNIASRELDDLALEVSANVRDGVEMNPQLERRFLEQMSERYGSNTLQDMAFGTVEVSRLSDITEDETQQREIAFATVALDREHETIGMNDDLLVTGLITHTEYDLRQVAKQVAREVETYGEAAFAERDQEQQFANQIVKVFGKDRFEELAQEGGGRELDAITTDPEEQRAIVYAVLKHEERTRSIGLDEEAVSHGLEVTNPRPGHEQDGHSI